MPPISIKFERGLHCGAMADKFVLRPFGRTLGSVNIQRIWDQTPAHFVHVMSKMLTFVEYCDFMGSQWKWAVTRKQINKFSREESTVYNVRN